MQGRFRIEGEVFRLLQLVCWRSVRRVRPGRGNGLRREGLGEKNSEMPYGDSKERRNSQNAEETPLSRISFSSPLNIPNRMNSRTRIWWQRYWISSQCMPGLRADMDS